MEKRQHRHRLIEVADGKLALRQRQFQRRKINRPTSKRLLRDTPIKPERALTLLLALLLALDLVSNGLKDAYFDSIEALNVQHRQLQHFNTETARLQAAIRQYLAAPDETLVSRGGRASTEARR